jgi:mRNA interferase RelE/StbE
MSDARWELRVSRSAGEQLDRLPVALAGAVIETLTAIASDRRGGGTRLRFELEECWSARRGPYSVIYRIDRDKAGAVSVLAVTHRLARHS